MLIKAKLVFRECGIYINSDGEKMLRVRFLDYQDNMYTFFLPDTKENEKYKTMKKDTDCDLDLTLYKSNKGKYGLYANFGG